MAPSAYSPDCLFATVMFANPLGWFEASNLDKGFVESMAPLVRKWKAVRDDIFTGVTLPIGDCPDGVAWTGFTSVQGGLAHPDSAIILAFRELNPQDRWTLASPWLLRMLEASAKVEVLYGDCEPRLGAGGLEVHVPEKLGFILVRVRV